MCMQMAGICIICQALCTRRCSRCLEAYYCGVIHQRQDWARHRGDECIIFALSRRCVRCNRRTGRDCDLCTLNFSEELQAPAAQGMLFNGRALCSYCEAQYGKCGRYDQRNHGNTRAI